MGPAASRAATRYVHCSHQPQLRIVDLLSHSDPQLIDTMTAALTADAFTNPSCASDTPFLIDIPHVAAPP